MYSKPRLFKQSIMKSLPLFPSVRTSSCGGTCVSAARLGSGTGLRAGAGACAATFSGAARAAAPARPAPFKNPRRLTLMSFCFDMVVPECANIAWRNDMPQPLACRCSRAEAALDRLQLLVRLGRQLDADRIAGTHLTRGEHDAHDAALAHDFAVFVFVQERREQTRLKALDLAARITQTRHLPDCRGAKMQPRAGRERQKIDPARRHIVADLARLHDEAARAQFVIQLGMEEMHLSEIGPRRVFLDAYDVLHGDAEMGVVLDAKAADKLDRRLIWLAEIVRARAAHGDDDSAALRRARFGVRRAS